MFSPYEERSDLSGVKGGEGAIKGLMEEGAFGVVDLKAPQQVVGVLINGGSGKRDKSRGGERNLTHTIPGR